MTKSGAMSTEYKGIVSTSALMVGVPPEGAFNDVCAAQEPSMTGDEAGVLGEISRNGIKQYINLGSAGRILPAGFYIGFPLVLGGAAQPTAFEHSCGPGRRLRLALSRTAALPALGR